MSVNSVRYLICKMIGRGVTACLALAVVATLLPAIVPVLTNGGAALARELSIEEIEQRKKWDIQREERRKKTDKKRKKQKDALEIKETISMAFLSQEVPVPPALSNLDPILTDEGIHGARIGTEDNNTTGAFLGQKYILDEVIVPIDGDVAAAFKKLVAEGHSYFIVDLPADKLLALSDLPEAKNILIFNIRATDDVLRNEQCRANTLHVIPSRAMKADALAQFLIKKRWKEWLLIIGPKEGDRLFAEAVRRSAKKFGAKIEDERTWDFTGDIRRTARAEVPVFTQDVDYDVLIVADEPGEFGEYLIWNTWDPRPVAGTQGLVPIAWHRTHEQWGAAQMQNRFRRTASRWMTSVDYAAWVAVRSIGEAVTRSKSIEPAKVEAYMLSPDFSIAAYKGIKVTYRPWNGQLRQRILLTSPRAMVSVSPQKEYLHQRSETDSLGFDKPETKCKLDR